MSKLVERMVSRRLTRYLEGEKLLPKFQSGFRARHSTETAILKVLSDILTAADLGKVSILGLLDMSAAFDKVDHSILFDRLETAYGFSGTVLSWMRSFLTDRDQRVVLWWKLICNIVRQIWGASGECPRTAPVCSLHSGLRLGTEQFESWQFRIYIQCSLRPTITWVPSGFSGYIWLDTKIVFKKNPSPCRLMFQHKQTARYRRSNLYLPAHAHADDLPVHIVVE